MAFLLFPFWGHCPNLFYADYDSRTVWPSPERMPSDFDPKQIMDLGTDPGLGILSLHAHGITGRGVNVAMIDQPLLVEHQEYANRLRLYEEISIDRSTAAQMHGPAVRKSNSPHRTNVTAG